MEKYIVSLAPEERIGLQQLVSRGRAAARRLTHARILLLADRDARGDEAIVSSLGVSLRTVERVRKRLVTVTERRTRCDYAQCIRELADVHYPRAKKIRLVQDNLNTHDGASLYEAFAPEEARRILNKIEFHYTPKRGIRVNMAETEINIMTRQCLNRRLESQALIGKEVAAWEKERNARRAKIHWTFTLASARCKLKKLYPSIED